MKTKQLIVLLVLVVVLGLTAYFVNRRGTSEWREESETASTVLPESFDAAGIYSVTFKDASKSVRMERTDDGWKVSERYGYPANFQELTRFIRDLTDTRIAQDVPLTPTQEEELKLSDKAGAVTATLAGKDGKILKSLVFGKKHEKESEQPAMSMYGMGGSFPTGRYIKLDNGKCVLVANTFALVDNSVTDWLDKDFFKISDLKSATLSENTKPLWTVSRDSTSAELAILGKVPDSKEPDSTKLSAIKNAFSWIRFNDVCDPAAKPADTGMDKPRLLTIMDFDGNVYTVTFGAKVNGKQYLKVGVTWNGATVRPPVKDEKPEDKAKKDADFDKKIKKSREKAEKLNAKLSPWLYEVGTSALSAVDKSFDELLKDKPKPKPTENNAKKDAAKDAAKDAPKDAKPAAAPKPPAPPAPPPQK